MEINTNNLDFIYIVDDSFFEDESRINTVKSNELYIASSLSIEANLTILPEGRILDIILSDAGKESSDEFKDFLMELGKLRDYYSDLTVKVTVINDANLNDLALPDGTIKRRED